PAVGTSKPSDYCRRVIEGVMLDGPPEQERHVGVAAIEIADGQRRGNCQSRTWLQPGRRARKLSPQPNTGLRARHVDQLRCGLVPDGLSVAQQPDAPCTH